MRLNIYIVSIFLIFLTNLISGQKVQNLLVGTKGAKYWVTSNTSLKYFWQIDGGTIVNGSGTSEIRVNWGKSPGKYQIKVYGESAGGCISNLSEITVNLNYGNGAQIPPLVTVCPGDTFLYDAGLGFIDYQWHDGSKSRFYSASDSGNVWVAVTDSAENIYTTLSKVLWIKPPKITLFNDTVICDKRQIVLDAGGFASSYIWSTGETTQKILVQSPTKLFEQYWVNVQDTMGCQSYDTVRLYSCSNSQFAKTVPSAFTPNGDGINDYWILPQVEPYNDCVVEVYDRWGRLVYKSEKGYPEPWNGNDFEGKELGMDAYYFIISLVKGKKSFVGTITILR